MYLKSAIFFVPIFVIFYGVNPYGNNTTFLYNNPFGTLTTEQWLQESPIQFFLGYFLNIFIENEESTFNFINIIGFIFLYFSLYSYDSKNSEYLPILKILYFTPFFLILFYWMGKPDTFTIGSLFLLISYKDKICSFQILCSKGTYIRSIARDLGKNLGCGGHMFYLKRLSQHKFSLFDAHTIEELSLERTIKIDDFFKDYEKLSLNEESLKIFLNGGRVFLNKDISKDLRIYSEDNDFIGLGRLENSYLKHKQLV